MLSSTRNSEHSHFHTTYFSKGVITKNSNGKFFPRAVDQLSDKFQGEKQRNSSAQKQMQAAKGQQKDPQSYIKQTATKATTSAQAIGYSSKLAPILL